MQKDKFNILYSGDLRGDVITLCEYIDEFFAAQGVSAVDITIQGVFGAVGAMLQQFPSPIGSEHASPFKKVAAFTTFFVSQRPIITALPLETFGDLATHQNAILAWSLSVDALHGAVIKCPKRGDVVLANRISVSKHFWQDAIAALSSATPAYHFNCVSLIYESLAYQANPDASYDKVV